MTKRQKRLVFVSLVLVAALGVVSIIVNSFRDSMVFFISPSEVQAKEIEINKSFRLGGMVENGSVVRDEHSAKVRFLVTDTSVSVPVEYEGILPDLFREGQGVVADGKITSEGVFVASRVLAKHDEEYMPIEATKAVESAKQAAKTLAEEQL